MPVVLSDGRRMLRRIILLALAAMMAIYLVLPVAFGIATVLPAREEREHARSYGR